MTLPDLSRVEEFQRKHRLGLLTLVFTDIVGSTRLKQQYGDAEGIQLIQRHHGVVREVLGEFGQAEEIETAGDSFLLVFALPSDAVRFSLLIRARLQLLAGENRARIFDRIGIHVGEVFIQQQENSTKLFGGQVDLCARVMSLGMANQILMTRFVFDTARQMLRGQDLPGVGPLRWLNHGLYQFKGIEEPAEVCEVRVDRDGPITPPTGSDKAQRYVLSEGEPVLGWRPALEQKVPGTEWILECKLGEGGFGEVWLGRQEKLKEKRVFKFCFRADRVRALKREVTLFRLMKEKIGQHPNIVGIQEVFFDQPPFYIVMDYSEGQDLRAWCEAQGGVDKVPMPVRLEIVSQVADALEAAHQAGVIHRDVKPSNILISNQKSATQNATLTAKLTDFGIGQVVSQEALVGITRIGFTQTMLGAGSSSNTGTQMYMAPELIAGQPASGRSDIYSLGVVLYQLVIGDFSRPLTTDWAKQIEDPLLREDLEKCFAGNPQERFASASRLGQNLRTMERRRAVVMARQRAARRSKFAASAVLTAVVLAAFSVVIPYLLRLRDSSLGGSRNPQTNLAYESGSNNPQANFAHGWGSNRPQANFAYRGGIDALNNKWDERQLEYAVERFQIAINTDTNFALAYIGLAQSCWILQNLYQPTNNWGQRGFEAAQKSIQICPDLADGYVVRGALAFTPFKKWDYKSDVEDQRRALDRNRRVKNAHFYLAFVYQHLGFLNESAEEAKKELDIDPNDMGPLWLNGQTVTFLGRYKEGLDMLNAMPERTFPHRRVAVWEKAVALMYCGSNSLAAAELNRTLGSGEVADDGLLASLQAVLCAAAGDKEGALQKIGLAKAADDRFIDFHHIAYDIGSAYAMLGKPEEAIDWLKQAAQKGYPCYDFFVRDPNLAALAGNEEFKKFLKEQEELHKRYRAELFHQ